MTINVTENLKFDTGWAENFVGKGENAGYQHFLFFPQCFQKASFQESGLCGKELNPSQQNAASTTLKKRVEKTMWESEKMLVTIIFSFSHSIYFPLKDKSNHWIYGDFYVCNGFQIFRVQNFLKTW